MKLAVIAALATTIMSAHGASQFGGIQFHSTVPADQVTAITADLKYLYSNPVTKLDQDFIAVSQLANGTGPSMHNWLLNRVRYIVGETFELKAENLLASDQFIFPNTPIPSSDLKMRFSAEGLVESEDDNVKTIMSNMGAQLYVMGKTGFLIEGKHTQLLVGVNFDEQPVFISSPRVGLLKVGAGLFLKDFNISPEVLAPANSINRLATLFHEARHSDGNGLNTGFLHAACPVTHTYKNHYACEKVTNGPYTIGALATRSMLFNCSTCTEVEMNSLAIGALDSFSRILSAANSAARLEQYKAVMKKYIEMITTYKSIMLSAKSDSEKTEIQTELSRLEKIVAGFEADIKLLKADALLTPLSMDATPEGYFRPMSLEESMKTMLPVSATR